MKFTTVLFSLLFGASAFSAPQSIREILTMNYRPDGLYEVLCIDGTRQTISPMDLTSNAVCGGPSEMSFIQVMVPTDSNFDGYFNVICQDSSFEEKVHSNDIQSGKACSYRTPELLGEGATNRTYRSKNFSPNQVMTYPITLTSPIETKRWGVLINQNIDPAMSIAVYADDGGKPGKLLAQSGTMNVDFGRNEILSPNPVSLVPGTYWMALVVEMPLIISLSERTAKKTYVFTLHERLPTWPLILTIPSDAEVEEDGAIAAVYTMTK